MLYPWKTWEVTIENHPYLFCVAMAIIGLVIHPDLDMLMNVILSFALGSFIIIMLKRGFRIKRKEIITVQDYRFPSYHAGISSCLSFTVMLHHSDIGIPFVIMAVIACAARVTSRNHTTNEVVGGFAVGPLIAFISWVIYNVVRWW